MFPKKTMVLSAAACLLAASASAQTPPAAGSANPFTDGLKAQATQVRNLVLRTAEKVPEELYSFKATPDVRSIAGLLGHIADANVGICTFAKGEKPDFSTLGNEKKTAKADLIAGLKQAFAFCDEVFATLNDQNGTAMVEMFGMKQPKLGVMAFNNSHTFEHYGNLVTYMRLNKIIPPSSEPRR